MPTFANLISPILSLALCRLNTFAEINQYEPLNEINFKQVKLKTNNYQLLRMLKQDHEIGKAYLKKAGTDVIAIAGGIKMVFSPGSAYQDINKEKLPEKFYIRDLGEYSFSKNFKKFFEITHHVDLERLLRASSILITKFNGPETNDNMKNHKHRLFNAFMVKPGNACEDLVSAALVTFGEILKIKKKKISLEEYRDAAKIIGDYFKLWNYSDAISQFFGTM